MKNQPFHRRVGFALAGLRRAFASEASLRIEATVGVAAIAVCAWLGIPPVWWALIVLAMAIVLAAELFNTALERLADRLHPERHDAIRDAKDMGAAAVFVASLGALVLAGLVVLTSLQ